MAYLKYKFTVDITTNVETGQSVASRKEAINSIRQRMLAGLSVSGHPPLRAIEIDGNSVNNKESGSCDQASGSLSR